MSAQGSEQSRLRRGAEELGVSLGEAELDKLLAFLERLYLWNKSAGLTSIDRSQAVRLHLLDSLAAVPLLEGAARIADLGSGPGLPGIPLAIALPSSQLVLVESRRRKCSFLCETVRELGLDNCRVEQIDAYDYSGAEGLDAVIARAFLAPADLLALAAPLLRPGGRLLVMAGHAHIDDQLHESAAGLGLSRRQVVKLQLPGGNESRQLLVFTAEPV